MSTNYQVNHIYLIQQEVHLGVGMATCLMWLIGQILQKCIVQELLILICIVVQV